MKFGPVTTALIGGDDHPAPLAAIGDQPETQACRFPVHRFEAHCVNQKQRTGQLLAESEPHGQKSGDCLACPRQLVESAVADPEAEPSHPDGYLGAPADETVRSRASLAARRPQRLESRLRSPGFRCGNALRLGEVNYLILCARYAKMRCGGVAHAIAVPFAIGADPDEQLRLLDT